jgi:hypothetical protein
MHVLHLFLEVLDTERQTYKKGFSGKLRSPEVEDAIVLVAHEIIGWYVHCRGRMNRRQERNGRDIGFVNGHWCDQVLPPVR